MKTIQLTKNWTFHSYTGKKETWKKGMVISVNKGMKITEEGLLISHFYCYGQGEIIPKTHFKVLK